jgi:hydrogenase 3 maturation protease
MTDLEEDIRASLDGKRTVILGVGNPLRGDDGVGSVLAARLQTKLVSPVIDAGEVPENFIGPIIAANPEVLLIIDAANLGLPPGGMAIIDTKEIANASISTHSASLNLFLMVLQTEIQPEIFFLGIQPMTIDFGGAMSLPVKVTLNRLVNLLKKILPGKDS